MMKLLLVFYAIIEFFKFLVNIICRLFRKKPKTQSTYTSTSDNWYGICENCGKKGGLHRLDGKRYCAKCYARLKTEKDFSAKIEFK